MKHFDPDGPFYQMVSTFTASLKGFEVFDVSNPMQYKPSDEIIIEGLIEKEVRYSALKVFENVQQGYVSQKELIANLCCMLVNTAYESVKKMNDESEIFEFFFHLRNASSHGNKFFFRDNQPKFPAEWGGIKIDHCLKGTSNPLHGAQCFGKILNPADILSLLFDIEQGPLHKMQGVRQG